MACLPCLDDNQLSGFVQGTLAPTARAEVESHIDGCADCRTLLSALGQLAEAPTALKLEQVADLGVPGPGEVIAGKYRIERVVGVGGMGVVVAATHLDLHQIVALKFMHPSVLSNPAAVRRFLAEARAVVRLKSGHVGRVLDLGKLDGGSPYIVMEYLEGIDLDHQVSNAGPLPVAVAAQYVLQALEAVAEAHAAGIVHRDLKPANLFLTAGPDGAPWIKVLDFGVSKYTQPDLSGSFEATDARTVLGSPLYMSPEQLRSAAAADARSDIWSLGCTLYQLVSGHTPFDEPSFSDLIAAILNKAPRPLRSFVPEAPLDYVELVHRCLAKDPAERPQDVAELARELSACLPAALAASTPVPAPVARARPYRRLAVAAAGIMVVSGVAIAGLVHRSASEPVAVAETAPVEAAPEAKIVADVPPPLPPLPIAPAKPAPVRPLATAPPAKAKPKPSPAAANADADILGRRK